MRMRCRAWLLLLALPRAGSLAQRADRAAVVKLYHLLNGPWWRVPRTAGPQGAAKCGCRGTRGRSAGADRVLLLVCACWYVCERKGSW